MSARIPLVLVSGQLCTERIWHDQIVHLQDVAEITTFCPADDDTVAQAARRILDAAPPRFALGAHAMGGFVAFEILRQAPGRVTRLALLATNAEADPPSQLERRQAYARMAAGGRFEELIEQRYPLVLHPSRVDDPAYRAVVAEMARAIGAQRFLHQQNIVLSRPDSRPALGAIRCPCLLIVGREDRLATVAQHRDIAARVPHAELHVIEDCGHFSTVEKPDEVNRLLRGWLRAAA